MSDLARRKNRYVDDVDDVARVEAARKEASERYITLHQSAREAQRRAMGQRLSVVELRVFTAVLALTKDWSRFSDEVSLAQLGQAAGIGGTAKTQATRAGKAARNLAALGVITYEPTKGRGAMVRIGIERVVLGPRKEDNLRPTFGPKELHEEATEPAESESHLAQSETTSARKWDRRGDPTRRDPEDLSENPDAGGRATGADPPSIGDVLASGVFDQGSKPTEPPNRRPPGAVDELLRAIARAVPAAAGRELLDDRSQGPGRTTLRALLVRLEALVGFEAAVACVAGEWPKRVHTSAMAVAIGRARARVDPPAPSAAAEPADPPRSQPTPPRQATLDDDSPPQPPVWEPPAETARSPPPEAERARWRQALNRHPRSDE